MRITRLRTVVSAWLLVWAAGARAASVPVGFSDRKVADGLSSPTSLTVLPDGRVLVVQQNGIIRLIQDDALRPDNFWAVPSVDSSGERGCMGVVPDPDFTTNHFVYLYCTIAGVTSNNHILRVTEHNGSVVAGSEQLILALPQVTDAKWHMGGAMRFGPDGMLYVAVGNQEDDPLPEAIANSQQLSNPFGKILRIRRDGTAPSDNPFVDTDGAYPAIWSYGFRNPFTLDIQPGTGRIFVGEVGQGTWEEINEIERGANYGWPAAEGRTDDVRFKAPFYQYLHSSTRCAVTGGAFYNPAKAQFPAAYVGTYMFQDFCGGMIELLDVTTGSVRPFVTDIGFPTNLAVAPDGSLYYLSRNQDTLTHEPGVGSVGRITFTGRAVPRIARHPDAQTVYIGDPVTFELIAQDAEHIQWQRDGVDIPGAVGPSYTITRTAAADDGAVFVAVASNEAGETKSAPARLTITTNRSPTAQIVSALSVPTSPTSPTSPTIEFAPGEKLVLQGAGSDPEDGSLPESAFTWQVDYQHDSHSHPLYAATSGSGTLSMTVPDLQSEDANMWLRVYLLVTDSEGAVHRVDQDIFPRLQLSSLVPLAPALSGWGPIERDRSNGEDAANDGRPLSIAGITFPKGLGVHAPADLRFDLGMRCSGKFLADVGVDDEVGAAGSVVFRVFVDDVRAYESPVKRGGEARSNVVVSVAGAKQLRLLVDPTDDGNVLDHADWGGAHVTGCASRSPDPPAAGSGGSAAPPRAGSSAEPPPTPTTPTPQEPAAGSGATITADAGTRAPTVAGSPAATPPRGGAPMYSGGTTAAPGPDLDAGVLSPARTPDAATSATASQTSSVRAALPSGTARRDGGCALTPRRVTTQRDQLWGALALGLWWLSRRRRLRRARALREPRSR